MPKYRIEGEVYEAANPDEAYAKHDQAKAVKAGYQSGRQMSPVAQAALTAGQGATFNFLDEIAAANAMRGAAEMQRGMGMAGLRGPQIDAAQAGAPMAQMVRGATTAFAERNPALATGLEIGGGLSTIPLTGPLSFGRGVTGAGRFMRSAGDLAAQGALAGAGAAEEGQAAEGAASGAALGMVGGGAANVLGRVGRGVIGRPIMSRLPAGVMGMIPEEAGGLNVRPDYPRERLARLLERDAQARIMGGVEPGQEAVMAARRLQKLGKEAPIAVTGSNTLAEIDMLANLPGTAGRQLMTQKRRIEKGRGGAIIETAERVTGVGRSAEDELADLAKRQAEAASPLYEKLQTIAFPVDAELQNILNRSKLDLGAAQRTATRRGEPQVALRKIKEGDELPFASADQLKRTLWDKAEAARRAGNKNEAADLDRLRLDLVSKLDSLSPDYAKARKTYAGFAELQNAVEQGRSALSETSESLSKLTDQMTPSELEAFRVGAVDALRGVAGGQAGQTRLLNMYKEPELQGKLRAIFGNDFRKFQRTILAQEELKKIERQGGGSQTFRRFGQAQDQAEDFDALQAAQSVGQAVSSPQGFVQGIRQFGQRYGMPEEQRNRLARLLMLRDIPAQEELRNMEAYMRRRAAGQALGRQVSGRAGAFGASQE